MARETEDAREARLKRGGAWLREQRKARDWTQARLAAELQINQVQISTYERGSYEVDSELARDVARLFGLSQREVWVGLELPLPHDLTHEDITAMTGPEAVAYVRRLHPGAIEEVLRQVAEGGPDASPEQQAPKRRRRGRKSEDVTRPDEDGPRASRG